MPQAGSGGAETYVQASDPRPAAQPGDYWDDGVSVRLLSRTNTWIVLGGPAVDLTV